MPRSATAKLDDLSTSSHVLYGLLDCFGTFLTLEIAESSSCISSGSPSRIITCPTSAGIGHAHGSYLSMPRSVCERKRKGNRIDHRLRFCIRPPGSPLGTIPRPTRRPWLSAAGRVTSVGIRSAMAGGGRSGTARGRPGKMRRTTRLSQAEWLPARPVVLPFTHWLATLYFLCSIDRAVWDGLDHSIEKSGLRPSDYTLPLASAARFAPSIMLAAPSQSHLPGPVGVDEWNPRFQGRATRNRRAPR